MSEVHAAFSWAEGAIKVTVYDELDSGLSRGRTISLNVSSSRSISWFPRTPYKMLSASTMMQTDTHTYKWGSCVSLTQNTKEEKSSSWTDNLVIWVHPYKKFWIIQNRLGKHGLPLLLSAGNGACYLWCRRIPKVTSAVPPFSPNPKTVKIRFWN